MITRRSAKQKGRKGQKEVVETLLETFTGLTTDDIQSTPASVNGIDIKLSKKALEQVPYSIEVKYQEKINIWSSLEQASKNCKANTDPVLIFRRNRTKAYAVIELDHFIKLISK